LGLARRSATFHGRDLYAPAGALLASGAIAPEACGPPIRPLLHPMPDPSREGSQSKGQVITVDHFGNMVTNLTGSHLPDERDSVEVRVGEDTTVPLVDTYGDVTEGTVVALVGSGGLLEVACNQGSAADTLGVGVGCPVQVRW
ncbi:MAG: SAM-dependent chlorinase/fluorinase, partial [Myxococcota bacterium]|nr:SAM-dependent chlorinase/fluorinase [Myxococcota bacterium]